MIIENGTLQTIEKTGGGMKNGKPVKVEEVIGNPIPCNLKTITHNHKGKTIDGVFTQASFEVLIDVPVFSECIKKLISSPPKTLYEVMQFSVLYLYFEENDFVGFDTELAKTVFTNLGYKVRFKLIVWENKYIELNNGTVVRYCRFIMF